MAISLRNDRSLSSASATMYSLAPSRALLPKARSAPPITAVGSRPARSSTSAIIDVVVVLPCAPPTAIAEPQPHQLGQHLGARDHRDAPAFRLDHFGVGRPHRRRDHDHVDVADVRGVVTSTKREPESGEPFGRRRPLHVGSAHRVAQTGEHLRDAAHPDPADPDEVDRSRAPQHALLRSIRRQVAAADQRERPIDDDLRAASGRASSRAAPAIRAAAFRVAVRAPERRQRSARPSARVCVDHLGRARTRQRLRVLALVIVGRRRQRNENRRAPAAVISASVVAPARQTIRSAAVISRSIS